MLLGWAVCEDGGVYAAMPLGRLVPAKTRLFVDEGATAIKAEGVLRFPSPYTLYVSF